jgi:hypothetical protein
MDGNIICMMKRCGRCTGGAWVDAGHGGGKGSRAVSGSRPGHGFLPNTMTTRAEDEAMEHASARRTRARREGVWMVGGDIEVWEEGGFEKRFGV